MSDPIEPDTAPATAPSDDAAEPAPSPERPTRAPDDAPAPPREIGGPKGPEPTRYGDWEQKGRCTDF